MQSIFFGVVAWLATVVVVSAGSGQTDRGEQSEQKQDRRAASLTEAVNRGLRTRNALLVPLTVDTATPGRAQQVVIPVEGQLLTFALLPHSVRAPEYQVLEHRADGSLAAVKPEPVRTVRGFALEDAEITIAGGVLEDGLYAQMRTPGGRQWWVQPAAAVAEGASEALHAIYLGGDVSEFPPACTTESSPQHAGAGISLRGGTARFQALLAVDAEFQFYRQTGSSSRTQSMVNLLVNVVNVQYEREVDIRHLLGTVIIRTFQNYDPTSTTQNMRQQFQAWWNANHQAVPRDVAIQLDANGNGGQAAPGNGVCDIPNAYAGCGMDWYNLAYRTDVIAHELGHLWGACHCACSSPRYTMDPIVQSVNRFEGSPATTPATDAGCGFHAGSVAQILARRNAAGCLDMVTAASVVPNDTCANAVNIPCQVEQTPFVCDFGFHNRGSTTDGPLTGCRAGHSDIWYRYVAPCGGAITVSTCEATFDTVLFAYAGAACPPSPNSEVACSDDNPAACPSNPSGAYINFLVTAGETYLIRVAGYSGAQGAGVLVFRGAACSPPANDACIAATPVGQLADVSFTTVGATTGTQVGARDSYLETAVACALAGDSQISNDIWFRYVAPCEGTTRFTTCGSTFDTKIAIYAQCPTGDNQRLACNDDAGGSCGVQSLVDAYLFPGVTYLVRVGGFAGQTGTGTLRVESFNCPPPNNDNCATSFLALSDGSTVFGTTFQGTRDGSAGLGQADGPDVWYTYTPSCTGVATIDTCGSASDTVLSVHTACTGTVFNQIIADDDACGNLSSRLSLSVIAGRPYTIRVAAYSLATAGNFWLRAACVPAPPPNDACDNATDLTACGFQTFGTLVSATSDGSSTCGSTAGNPDVWYTFTAPYAGRLIAATCGTHDIPQSDQGVDTVLSIHSGCPGTAANQLAAATSGGCVDDSADPDCYQVGILRDSYVAYDIAAGESVRIRVSKYLATPVGPIFVYVRLIPTNATCAGAIDIGDGVTMFCTTNAGTELTQFPYMNADLWYRYVAPCTGEATADLCGSDTNMRLAVFRDFGDCPPSGGYVTTGFESWRPGCGTFTGAATFSVTEGEAYLIEVGNRGGENGVLAMSCVPNTGACCLGPVCIVLSEAECVNAGGAFQGIAEPCKFPDNPVTCCPVNFNDAAGLSVQDIFDFLAAFFAGEATADFNESGEITVQDIFDFLSAYFAGCS